MNKVGLASVVTVHISGCAEVADLITVESSIALKQQLPDEDYLISIHNLDNVKKIMDNC